MLVVFAGLPGTGKTTLAGRATLVDGVNGFETGRATWRRLARETGSELRERFVVETSGRTPAESAGETLRYLRG